MAFTEIIAMLRTKSNIIYPVTQLKAITDDADALTTPADADSVPLADASDSGQMKKITWANIKTALSSVFAAKSHTHSAATTSVAGLMSAADKTKLNGIATGANKYAHPTYTERSSGLYKITVDATGHISEVTAVTKEDITDLGIPAQDTNTTYSAMTGATTSAAGKTGLVPAPAAGAATRYLRSDGTWQVPPNTTYSAATQSKAGLMSAADKKKLDGLSGDEVPVYVQASEPSKNGCIWIKPK